MANKIVVVFLMCIILAAAISVEARNSPAVQLQPKSTLFASADDLLTYNTPEIQRFKKCFFKCQDECPKLKGEYTECEMKCDTECTAKEFADKLNIKV